MGKWLSGVIAAVILVGPSTLLAQAAEDTPAISARFERARDFGHHIGDLIPLTLLIEATPVS